MLQVKELKNDYQNLPQVQGYSQEIHMVAALEVRRLRVGVKTLGILKDE